MRRVPGAGGVSGDPAKHYAISTYLSAVSPLTCSPRSAMFRFCVTTWQNASAEPSIVDSPSASFPAHTGLFAHKASKSPSSPSSCNTADMAKPLAPRGSDRPQVVPSWSRGQATSSLAIRNAW